MSTPQEQDTINILITRLLDTHISSTAFKKTLAAFLSAYSRPTTWTSLNFNSTPTTLFINASLTSLLDLHVAPRQRQTTASIANTTSIQNRLLALFPPTKQTLTATLGGKDRYDNIVDRKVLAEIVLLGAQAWKKKTVLEYRLWVAGEMVGKGFEECPWLGEMVIRVLKGEAKVQGDCQTLFLMEQENREMVLEWMGC